MLAPSRGGYNTNEEEFDFQAKSTLIFLPKKEELIFNPG